MTGVTLFVCLFTFFPRGLGVFHSIKLWKSIVLKFFNLDLIELTQYQCIFVSSNNVRRIVFFIENWFGLVKKGMKQFIPFVYLDGACNDVRKSGNFDY